MFERFTEEARQVIVAAQEEGRLLDHDHIGTEHILIGLARSPEDLPGRALSEFGVDAEMLRAKVAETFGRGDHPCSGQLPFTPGAKKALELALRAALKLGPDWIESGHVLLGLVDARPSPGYEILTGVGVDVDSLRERVVELLAAGDRPRECRREVVRRPSVQISEVANFLVTPDSRLQRVLMTAAGRALQQGRQESRIEDVLDAINESSQGEEPQPPGDG